MTSKMVQTLRQQFTADYHRPQYHFLPPSNWMNDPNGVIQWGGQYHLFYQYNPFGANHANMHWGHAVSEDLIHWQDLPVAMKPSPESVDEGGIFSGCIINDNSIPKMFYTGVNKDYQVQTQCLAIGNADLSAWEKHHQNPVIGTVPASLHQSNDFRDPFVWQEGAFWYMAVGSRIQGVGGAILLYQSEDLFNWRYLHPLLVGSLATTGVMWECPNFFQLEDKWVLIISSHIGYATGTVLYFVGAYENYRFIPEVQGVLDPGYYYAPLTHLDNDGRRIMYGWIREGRSIDKQVKAGWSGVQAIPRVLSLDSQNRIIMSPVSELQAIRHHHVHITGKTLSDSRIPVNHSSLEIHACFVPTQMTECGIALAVSDESQEQLRILYDTETETLCVHRQYANPTADLDTEWQGIPHRLETNEKLELVILFDASVIEIIANGRTSLTSRFYAQSQAKQNIEIFTPQTLESLDIYEMPSIWS